MSKYDVEMYEPGAVGFDRYTEWVKTKEKVVPELVMNEDVFVGLVELSARFGKVIDLFKKRFLGKNICDTQIMHALCDVRYAARCVDEALFQDGPSTRIDVNTRLYHAALGKLGECAELLSAVGEQHRNHGVLDVPNVKEEFGDDAFYTAFGLDAIVTQLADVLERNEDKLEIRYPNGFTVEASDNRNIAAERAALEADPETAFQGTPGMEMVGSSFRPIRGCGQTLGDIIDEANDKLK